MLAIYIATFGQTQLMQLKLEQYVVVVFKLVAGAVAIRS